MGIAPAAVSSLCDDDFLFIGNIGDYSACFGIFNNSANRHADIKRLCFFAGAAGSAAVLPVFSAVFPFISEIGKGGKVTVGNKYYIAASAAVAAVGSACGNIFFSMERYGAVAPVTGL